MIKQGRYAVLLVVALVVNRAPQDAGDRHPRGGLLDPLRPRRKASTVSPLPASDYTVQSACAAPARRHVACLAEILVARTAAARARTHPLGMTMTHAILPGSAAEGADGLRPQDLRSAYFPGEVPDAPASEPQTIAIVDAYDDLQAESDLGVYDSEFRLPRMYG